MIRTKGLTQNPAEDAATETPFDFYLDGWDSRAAALQETGDLILIGLPFGFYGAIVVGALEGWRGPDGHSRFRQS